MAHARTLLMVMMLAGSLEVFPVRFVLTRVNRAIRRPQAIRRDGVLVDSVRRRLRGTG